MKKNVFSPENDGVTNAAALQAMLDKGGDVVIDIPGTYDLARTVKIPSNTHLEFKKGVFIRRTKDENGVYARFAFCNEGLLTDSHNENISLVGLNLIINHCSRGDDVPRVVGCSGQVAFCHISDLVIEDLTIVDDEIKIYNIQIQDFERVRLENIRIESQKDGIHFGVGKDFVIRNVWLKTNDDGIALNAHDYPTATVKFGWIENGVVENIHFMEAPDYNSGRGLYMLGGAWSDWKSGNTYRYYGDSCVSCGRVYCSMGDNEKSDLKKEMRVSTCMPCHESGFKTYSDGFTWLAHQEGETYSAGVRNVIFKDIFFERETRGAMTFQYDNDIYSRSYYPGAEHAVMENITLENLHIKNECVNHTFISVAPADNVRIINSDCYTRLQPCMLTAPEGAEEYPPLNVSFSNCSFKFSDGNKSTVVLAREKRSCNLTTGGSMVLDKTNHPSVYGENVKVLKNDIGIE